jgi:hypothetical protein
LAAEFSSDNPAAKYLDRLTVPTGLLDCSGGPGTTGAVHRLTCWSGDLEPRDASAATRLALMAVGARQLTEHCRALRQTFVVCRIDAKLGGQPVAAFIDPREETTSPSHSSSPPTPGAEDPQGAPASPSAVPRTWAGSQVSLSVFTDMIPALPTGHLPVTPG